MSSGGWPRSWPRSTALRSSAAVVVVTLLSVACIAESESGQTNCANDCSGHGKCDQEGETFSCACMVGFAGADCGLDICSVLDDCSGHGRCLLPGADGEPVSAAEEIELSRDLEQLVMSLRHPKPNLDPQLPSGGALAGSALGCKCDADWQGLKCKERTCERPCVSGRGECFDGACRCLDGFAGQQCEFVACQNGCWGNGECKGGLCACKPGFSGFNCETGPGGCPAWDGAECSGNGICVDGHCFCSGSFMPPDCARLVCLDNCFGHGVCRNGTCACHDPWEGDSCGRKKTEECFLLQESAGLPEEAAEHGSHGACPHCNGHGHCGVADQCTCDSGWGGFGCNMMLCPRACSGHGECEAGGTCRCSDGFTGPSCAEPRLCQQESDCSGHGICTGGRCLCDDGFGGERCDFAVCPGEGAQCSDNGKCVGGKCECFDGYYGDSCAARACPTNRPSFECSGHGTCTADSDTGESFCLCHPNFDAPYEHVKRWAGADCSEMQCPAPNCNGHGVCVDSVCGCESGWSGVACENQQETNCHTNADCGYPDGVCRRGRCYCRKGERHGTHCESLRGRVDVEAAPAHRVGVVSATDAGATAAGDSMANPMVARQQAEQLAEQRAGRNLSVGDTSAGQQGRRAKTQARGT